MTRLEPNLFGDLQSSEAVAFDAITVRFVCQGPPCSGLALINPRELEESGPLQVKIVEWIGAPDWESTELAGHDPSIWWLLPKSDEIEVLA